MNKKMVICLVFLMAVLVGSAQAAFTPACEGLSSNANDTGRWSWLGLAARVLLVPLIAVAALVFVLGWRETFVALAGLLCPAYREIRRWLKKRLRLIRRSLPAWR